MGRFSSVEVRRRLVRWAAPFAALVAGCGVAVLVLELLLRLAPGIFSLGFQNLALSRYDSRPGGLYVHDPVLRIHFLRRNADVRTCWNGWFWTHHGDARGFRNPDGIERHDVLLVGDSMIYGHGAEAVDTVASKLREGRGLPVYDMSRQGGCLYDHYVVLRLYLEELRPRKVLLFVFINDFADLLVYRTVAEIEDPSELERVDYEAARRRLDELNRPPPLVDRALWRLASFRVLHHAAIKVRETLREIDLVPSAEAAGTPEHPIADPLLEPEPFELVSGYYRRVLGDLDRRCDAVGAELVLVELAIPHKKADLRQGQERLGGFLVELGAELGLEVWSTSGLFDGCRDCFLPHDGHLTEVGHERLAGFLAERLQPESSGAD